MCAYIFSNHDADDEAFTISASYKNGRKLQKNDNDTCLKLHALATVLHKCEAVMKKLLNPKTKCQCLLDCFQNMYWHVSLVKTLIYLPYLPAYLCNRVTCTSPYLGNNKVYFCILPAYFVLLCLQQACSKEVQKEEKISWQADKRDLIRKWKRRMTECLSRHCNLERHSNSEQVSALRLPTVHDCGKHYILSMSLVLSSSCLFL